MKLIFSNLRTRYLCEISYSISYQKDVFFPMKVTLQEILVLNESKRFLKVFNMLPRSDWSSIRLAPQIPWCTSLIFHNAPCCNRNVHMCAHFCYKWCIVGYSSDALWDLCVGSINWGLNKMAAILQKISKCICTQQSKDKGKKNENKTVFELNKDTHMKLLCSGY